MYLIPFELNYIMREFSSKRLPEEVVQNFSNFAFLEVTVTFSDLFCEYHVIVQAWQPDEFVMNYAMVAEQLKGIR